MKKITAYRKQTIKDALVARETVMRDFRVELSKLMNAIEKEYSMTEKQAVALLIDILKKHRIGEFVAKHIDKPKKKDKA